MKRVLLAQPEGPLLYELSDAEFERLEHILEFPRAVARGVWVKRFFAERIPVQKFPPGTMGIPEGVEIDRAIGGNRFTPKWGRTTPPGA